MTDPVIMSESDIALYIGYIVGSFAVGWLTAKIFTVFKQLGEKI